MKIHGNLESGNCLKVKWTADVLNIPYEWVDVDIMKNESRTSEFLEMNPMGQVPVVVFDDGRTLAQSNGIIAYFSGGTDLAPADPFDRAKVNEMLFWEQYSHEPYIAVCRFQMLFLGKSKEEREAWRVERGEHALDLMEQLLSGKNWFVGDRMTIADIALVAYTRMAHEGGFDLALRPNVQAWITKCEQELGLDAA